MELQILTFVPTVFHPRLIFMPSFSNPNENAPNVNLCEFCSYQKGEPREEG